VEKDTNRTHYQQVNNITKKKAEIIVFEGELTLGLIEKGESG